MTDFEGGQGWWQASDGRWYPPDDDPLSMLPPPTADQLATSGPEVVGTPGRSARERARQIEEQAYRWDTGAEGEEATAACLEALPPGFHVLHDLHVPASKANIDHLVVGATGVWLIDSKKYRYPLRFNGGTIWSGKYPRSDDIVSVASYARSAESVLHVPVTPVLCFVGQQVPTGAEFIAGVRLVTLDDLLTLVSLPGAAPLTDVDSVARLARTLRTPTPARRSQRVPAVRSDPSPRSTPIADAGGGGTSLFAKAAVALLVALMLLAIVASALRVSRRAIDRLSTPPATTTVPPPRLDGPTIAAPSGEARVGILCIAKDAGWEAHFIWPTPADPAHVPVAYEVVSLTQGVRVDPKLWPNEQTLPKPLTGLPPDLKLIFAAQGILADGTRLTPAISTRVTPNRPC